LKNKIRKWDPTFGWNHEIYNLASCPQLSNKHKVPFFLRKDFLMKGNKIVLKSSKDYRICAGNFSEDFYFGSLTYVDKKNKNFNIDQSVVVYNKKFELLSEFRPSFEIEKPSKNFTLKKNSDNKFIYGFRDPAIMPNGNLAVSTGGCRWGTSANVCELSYKNNKFKILRESILDETLKIFSEIERCTFWNEFMFFSVEGALHSRMSNDPNDLVVAKLNKNGLYSYYGVIENSSKTYGCNVNKKLQLLFWYPLNFSINNPSKQNLFYENSKWILREEKILNHFFYRKIPIDKIKKEKHAFDIKLKNFFKSFYTFFSRLLSRIKV